MTQGADIQNLSRTILLLCIYLLLKQTIYINIGYYRMVYVDSRKEGGKIGEEAGTPAVRDRGLVSVKFSESPVEKQADQHNAEKILLIGKATSALGYDDVVGNRVGGLLCSARFQRMSRYEWEIG